MIDTTSVAGRRELRFETLDDMLADARQCASAARLHRLGNWSLGQALNHLAAWIDYPYLGYPPELVFTDDIKAQALAAKERFMNQPMDSGKRIPGSATGTYATVDVPTVIGLARLEAAATRLRSGPPTHPDPAFGMVTQEEWTAMNLRHAELHLGFFVPR